jgi:O-antigen/teichoic acid export membrane protein
MPTGKLKSAGYKLLSGSVLRMGNLVASALVGLFLLPFIVHHLGDRLYGFWSLTAAFIGYYGLLDLGLTSAISQYLCIAIGRNDPAESQKVFNTALRIQSFLGCLALLATALIAVSAPLFCHNPEDAALFWRVIAILGINAAIGFPARVYGGILEAELRFDIQSGLTLFGLVLRTGLTIWAVLAGGGLLALAWVTLVSSLPAIPVQIWYAKRQAPWARIDVLPVAWARTKSLFSYSAYTAVTMLADTLRFQIDPLVISAFIGLAAVTHYRVATVFMAYFINAMISTGGIFQPVLSQLHGAGDRNALEKVFFFATKVSLCISVFIGFSLISWGKPFINRWMGPHYQDAYWPMVVLSLAVLLDVCQGPSITLLYATFNHRFYTYVNAAEGIINLLVSLLLVRSLGILGVALGTLIAAFVIRIVVQPFFVCRVSELHYSNYMKFLGGNLLRCACLMGAAITISAWGLRSSYPYLVSSAVCAAAVYAAGSWLFVFNRREREQLLAAITNRGRKSIDPAAAVAAVQ